MVNHHLAVKCIRLAHIDVFMKLTYEIARVEPIQICGDFAKL